MIFMNRVDKLDKKDKVILIGRGPSTNLIDLNKINNQDIYDICTISDAMKIINRPTFAFHYHWTSLKRCNAYIQKAKYLMVNQNAYNKIFDKGIEDMFYIKDFPNMTLFKSCHRKMLQIIDGKFDIEVKDTLYNHCGSVVGAVNFLCGYMNYKEVHFIGFDGGLEYGNANYGSNVANGRKQSKIDGSINKYFDSWKATQEMMKFYPNTKLIDLKDYLIK